ncbi:MAG: RodZ domain-containing protein, partial [Acidobacteriota bacterium]
MESLGQELKKERQARNISIDEMSSSTKICGRYLEALEQDRFDVMPGGFFIKGIIRTYAKYVGLDESTVLEKYRQAGVFEEQNPVRTAAERFQASSPAKKKIIIGLVVALGAILVLVALMFLWKSRRPRQVVPPPEVSTVIPQTRASSPAPDKKAEVTPGQGAETTTAAPTTPAAGQPGAPPASQAPSQSLTQPSTQPAAQPAVQPAAQEPGAGAPVQTENKGLTMDITFQEETWIQIYGDGTLKLGGLFPSGRKVSLEASREILIYVGNAGGLTYLLTGRPGKSLGRSGEVLNNIRITLDNLKSFLREHQPP